MADIEVFLDMEDVMHGEQELSDESLVRDIREKIKVKMDIAKTLGAFFAGLLAAVVTFVSDSKALDQILSGAGNGHCWSRCIPYGAFYKYTFLSAVLFTTVAVVMFFSAMYAYDRLLMPRQFWQDEHSASILYRLMSQSWNRLFNVASFCLAIGLLNFAIVLLRFGVAEIVFLFGCAGIALIYSRFAVRRIRFSG
ncbi:hypothetical protein NKH56_33635 [Mesorhizobium sp. M1076]|uniref:hypothetical protein n=1 Tax=Mesorhizobium sp. M1076 TaxID=2957054 RepID=UPI00333B6A0E